MSFDGDEKKWICGRGGGVNLHRVSSIVRDIREPCLHHSPGKRHQMLRAEKWHSIFDSDGRVIAFQKALKSIIMGGVDPVIRAEVWEFLLGCYSLSSTSEYRKQLRNARRERYEDLIRECQMMHSTVGTGMLAYVVGSKVMDVRTPSNNPVTVQEEERIKDASHLHKSESSCDSAIFSSALDEPIPNTCFPTKPKERVYEDQYESESFFDFPPLPVTDLFRSSESDKGSEAPGASERSFILEAESVHSFKISDNVDLITDSSSVPLQCSNSETGVFDQSIQANDKRVSEWLWTLHRIVVDVVRTDGHLEFYEDSKNMARMSDILAVYAWIDPATGYCQGMSDLLSPFIVLYEDNADAFWCFEMLLRRMRDNFMMEGPIGVMKQLQALWKILELTDNEIFEHLSHIGAESLHFAFRMLLVLFRREVSFNEALCMWEMMWAADFDEAVSQALNENGLQHLTLPPLQNKAEGSMADPACPLSYHDGDGPSSPVDNVSRPIARNPFCGLARASFWAVRNDQAPSSTSSTAKIRCDELPVFCVAAILILNRIKITRETHSSDDMIKIFNDNLLKINVKRCVHLAIKLRKRYFYKLTKQANLGTSSQREHYDTD